MIPRWLTPITLAALLSSCATSGSHQPVDSPDSPVDPRDHPLGTGSVEFVGFSATELQDLRVIPEEGTSLSVPAGNVRIADVDGFWWKPSRQWFKIPDHCHTTITKDEDGQLRSQPACSELGVRIQKLRGGLTVPGWQNDFGNTGHGTDYPF